MTQFKKWLKKIDNFNEWLKNLNLTENNNAEKVKSLLKSNAVIFFFKKDNEYFAGPEESRIIFAKIKTPDEDVNAVWSKEASFMGINLTALLKDGNPARRIFYKKDMKNMKVVDRKEIEKKLLGNKNV